MKFATTIAAIAAVAGLSSTAAAVPVSGYSNTTATATTTTTAATASATGGFVAPAGEYIAPLHVSTAGIWDVNANQLYTWQPQRARVSRFNSNEVTTLVSFWISDYLSERQCELVLDMDRATYGDYSDGSALLKFWTSGKTVTEHATGNNRNAEIGKLELVPVGRAHVYEAAAGWEMAEGFKFPCARYANRNFDIEISAGGLNGGDQYTGFDLNNSLKVIVH